MNENEVRMFAGIPVQGDIAKGHPVTVVAAWNGRYTDLPALPPWITLRGRVARCGPRNVLVERADGSQVVRPFRGLLVPPGGGR